MLYTGEKDSKSRKAVLFWTVVFGGGVVGLTLVHIGCMAMLLFTTCRVGRWLLIFCGLRINSWNGGTIVLLLLLLLGFHCVGHFCC